MRKLTRTTLAATAVVGLLAIPIAGAGAADTTVNMTLTSTTGTLSVTAPVTTGTGTGGNGVSSVDLGDIAAGASVTGKALPNALGTVTVSDTTTGLLRTSTTTVGTGLSNGTTPVGFCQGTLDTVTGTPTCSGAANTILLPTAVKYNFGTPTATGAGSTGATISPVNGAIDGTALVTFLGATPGEYTMTWSPTLSAILAGTELAGEYYGVITHTVTGANV